MTFRQAHRWISLTVAAIWLVQAITGTLSVFRWEIDDWTVAGEHVPVDYKALGARIDALAAQPDTSVSSVWTSGTDAGRFDIHYSNGEDGRVMRVDGQGKPLRDRSYDQLAAQGAIWDTITSVHTSLKLGDFGKWLIGLSGILLISNIALGLKLAWPKRGTWRKTLFGRPAGGPTAKLYGWHRKIGLWFAFPALLTVSAGVAMVFADGLEQSLGAEHAEPGIASNATGSIGFAAAAQTAFKTFPEASFSGVSLPSEEEPRYRFRLHNSGEVPRKWGTTIVWIAAEDGRVLGAYDAGSPRPERAVTDTLYALHTGQIGKGVGRAIVLVVGFCLLTLIGLGIPLWLRRRAPNKAAPATGRPQPAHSVARDRTPD